MKKILLYIVLTLILVACSDEIPEHHQPVRAKRAVLAYMVANNNLDGLIMQNIQWMYESLSTAKDTCTLVVYYKPSESNQYMKTAEILEFTTDGYGRINGQTILSGRYIAGRSSSGINRNCNRSFYYGRKSSYDARHSTSRIIRIDLGISCQWMASIS